MGLQRMRSGDLASFAKKAVFSVRSFLSLRLSKGKCAAHQALDRRAKTGLRFSFVSIVMALCFFISFSLCFFHQGKAVKCCLECKKNHDSLIKFARFRSSFEKSLRIEHFYSAYKKTRTAIQDSMQKFGGNCLLSDFPFLFFL